METLFFLGWAFRHACAAPHQGPNLRQQVIEVAPNSGASSEQ